MKLAIALGTVACLFLSGCGGNKMSMVVSPLTGKVVPYPKTGDTIIFPAGLQFEISTPCDASATPAADGSVPCKVAVTNSTPQPYLYDCTGCGDPEVIVGSDSGTLGSAAASPKHSADSADAIACTDHTVQIFKPSLSLAQGKTIQWVAVGDQPPHIQHLVAWSITTTPAGICQQDSIGNQQTQCTLKGDPGAYTYTVASTDPTCTQSTGNITITKP